MKKKADIRRYRKQRIDTYVSADEVERMRVICEKYEFKSIYKLLQYLVHCFLRVADPVNDQRPDEPIPVEIEEMFTDNAEWEKHKHSSHSHAGMNIKKKPDQRKIKTPDDLN